VKRNKKEKQGTLITFRKTRTQSSANTIRYNLPHRTSFAAAKTQKNLNKAGKKTHRSK
jgi:hypothetical protein